MRRAGLVILSSVVLWGVLDCPASAAEVTALKISNKTYDPRTQELTFELWNESGKVITAWRLSLARSDPHGHAQKSVLDQDFFEHRSDRVSPRSGPIDPGGKVEAKWSLEVDSENPGPTALSVKVAAAIFEDATWEGNADAASAILEARAARVEEIGRLLATLEGKDRQLRSRQAWSADLKQQAQLLRRQGQDMESLRGHRREVAAQISAAKLELAQWLDEMGQEVVLAPNPDETVNTLTDALRKRYESGVESLGPKAGGER